jgi:hypothetical protein
VEGNRSFKIFQLFAESVREPGQPADVHPQGVVLLFNVRSRNAAFVRVARNDHFFNQHNLRRGIPRRRFFEITQMRYRVGFYDLPVIRIFPANRAT